MPSVRAKFRCVEKSQTQWGEGVKLEVVTGGSPENKAFFQSSPSGVITLGIVNKSAADAFVVGKEYFVDFTPAEG